MAIERSPKQDLRQLGAMLLIVRNDRKVWVMPDEGKMEEAAGVSHNGFNNRLGDRFNVPAGGRNGFETSRKTLIEETREESGVNIPDDVELTQLHHHHFLVDQIKNDQLFRLAVGVWMMRVDQGSEIEQEFSKVSNSRWMKMGELRQALRNDDQSYRPQLLIAAAIASGLTDAETLHTLNQDLMRIDDQISQEHEWQTLNGVIEENDLIRKNEALIFLGLTHSRE